MTMTELDVRAPRGRYRVKHVARGEVAKIMTLRSTAIALGLTLVACLAVTVLQTHSQLHHDPRYYRFGFDATQDSLTGMIIVALTGGVFGALLITSEYSSGTIRSTLAASPRRATLVATKIGVTAAFTVILGEVLSFASFFLGQAVLSGGGAPSATLATPGAGRAVVMSGLFIALVALMSFGFGLIFRSTAAAIAAFVCVIFVLPLVIRGISEGATRYTPTTMFVNSIMATVGGGQGGRYAPVTPVLGLSLMTLYAATVLGLGAILFIRRDA